MSQSIQEEILAALWVIAALLAFQIEWMIFGWLLIGWAVGCVISCVKYAIKEAKP